MNDKTKTRLQQAIALAKEMFGEDAMERNPGIVPAIMVSMASDELSDNLTQQVDKLTDIIVRAASHIAD